MAVGTDLGIEYNLSSTANVLESMADDGTHFYILHRVDREVYKFNYDGTYTGTSFDINAQGATNARGMGYAVDHFYICDSGTDLVYKYTQAGVFVSSFSVASQMSIPFGIAYDGTHLLVGDRTGMVYKYNLDGTYASLTIDTTVETARLVGLSHVAGNLYVTDQTLKTIFEYDAAGAYTGLSFTAVPTVGNATTLNGFSVMDGDFWSLFTNGRMYAFEAPVPAPAGTDANAERDALIDGVDTSQSERDALIDGVATSQSERDAVIDGVATGQSERDALIDGVATSQSERDALIDGVATSQSERDALVTGSDTSQSERDALIDGVDTSQSERDALIDGVATSQSERDALIDGAFTSQSERDALIGGVATSQSERDALITGAFTSQSERDAVIDGAFTSQSERDAVIDGVATSQSERDALITGAITIQSERDALIDGVATSQSERDALIDGVATSQSERDALIDGVADNRQSGQRNALITGQGLDPYCPKDSPFTNKTSPYSPFQKRNC